MMSAFSDAVSESTRELIAKDMEIVAELKALEEVVVAMAIKLDVDFDGQDVQEFLKARAKVHRHAIYRRAEDVDPGMAAWLQQRDDELS
jgi:hypothetical protein